MSPELQQDFNTLWCKVDIEGALIDFLKRNGIEHQATRRYIGLHEIIVQAQPNWLDAPLEYVESKLLPEGENREGDDLKQWLHQRFLELFRYLDQPPEWIQ